jgi:hypothetical protein
VRHSGQRAAPGQSRDDDGDPGTGHGWPIYEDPRNVDRYFAVIADSEALADIVGAAPTASTSLKPSFGIWFSKPPSPGPRKSRARGR